MIGVNREGKTHMESEIVCVADSEMQKGAVLEIV